MILENAKNLTDMLDYMYRGMSQRQISRETGVARSTLYDWQKGGQVLSIKHGSEIRKAYQRTVYARMGEEGYAQGYRKRISQYLPKTVDVYTERIQGVIDRLSNRSVRDAATRAVAEGEDIDLIDELEKRRAWIKEGLQKSFRSIEEFERY